MTADIRQRCYQAIVRDSGLDPEAVCDRCHVILFAERRSSFGRYDDSIHLLTPETEYSFKGNVDPSRTGWNGPVGKYYAQLTPGVWPVRTGPHRGRPNNFRQLTEKEAKYVGLERFFHDGRALGKYTVKRVQKDLTGKTEHGYFAINGHSGAEKSTSSWGCWTFDPDDWAVFQPRAYLELAKHNQTWPDGWTVLVLTEAQ